MVQIYIQLVKGIGVEETATRSLEMRTRITTGKHKVDLK